CKRELNAINEHYADWQDETGVKLIAVSIDKAQDAAKVKPFVNSQGWEYDVILDPNSDFMHALGIQTTPHLLIIDGNGKIVESHSGYTEGSESQIIKKLRMITAPKKAANAKQKKAK
ncbi:MAG: TlpA family protein disulfide reductase, partial [Muribaculaceae bacterium]|nr:TlpA family protein disulfide reductase [Muribaculaceae bacterium]